MRENPGPVLGRIVDLTPGTVQFLLARPRLYASPPPAIETEVRVGHRSTAAVRRLLTGRDDAPSATAIGGLLHHLASVDGHTAVAAAFAAPGGHDLYSTCECGHRSSDHDERVTHLAVLRWWSGATTWTTQTPVRPADRITRTLGPHVVTIAVQTTSPGHRAVLLCDCGWYAVGAPGRLYDLDRALGEHHADQGLPDDDDGRLGRRAERRHLERLAMTDFGADDRLEAFFADRFRADLGRLTLPPTPTAEEMVDAIRSARATLGGWRGIGYTTDPGPAEHLADLDRHANTAAGIRARLAEIDAADRAGLVGRHQGSDPATWTPAAETGEGATGRPRRP